MNYDFKANWDSVILPLLSNPKVKKSVKKGILKYIEIGHCYVDVTYSLDKCPAYYGRGDGWRCYIDDYEEQLTEKLLETGYLKKDENEPLDDDKWDDYQGSPEHEKYLEYKEAVLSPFIKHHEKTSLRAYQMFGACHWWNPTFGLTLAKLLYPNENWKVVTSDYHTTVTNADMSLVFDILYFDENDETKGGKNALNDSLKKD